MGGRYTLGDAFERVNGKLLPYSGHLSVDFL